MSTEEITKKIEEYKEELFNLRLSQATGNLEKPSRIKELRKAKGLTQDKLSEKIGISCQGLKMIECGINGARIDTFVYLAEALDTTIDYLVLGRSCMVIDEE